MAFFGFFFRADFVTRAKQWTKVHASRWEHIRGGEWEMNDYEDDEGKDEQMHWGERVSEWACLIEYIRAQKNDETWWHEQILN